MQDESAANLHRCKVKSCLFASNSIRTIMDHEAKCRPTSRYECIQKARQKPTDSIRRELEMEGVIPENYHNMHFAVYDIGKPTKLIYFS